MQEVKALFFSSAIYEEAEFALVGSPVGQAVGVFDLFDFRYPYLKYFMGKVGLCRGRVHR